MKSLQAETVVVVDSDDDDANNGNWHGNDDGGRWRHRHHGRDDSGRKESKNLKEDGSTDGVKRMEGMEVVLDCFFLGAEPFYKYNRTITNQY